MEAKVGDFLDRKSQRAVLAGICRYGGDSFVDVDDLLDANAFPADDLDGIIYKSLEYHFRDGLDKPVDIPSILSAARSIGMDGILDGPAGTRHLRAIFNYPIEKETVRREAKKLYKLSMTQQLDAVVAKMRRDLRTVTGDESTSEITSIVENPIFDFVSRLNNESGTDGPTHIATGIDEFLDSVEANPRDNIGISSGFAKYDWFIGGGFRRATVSIVGARMKVGKAQMLTSQVFTSNGPVLMGDIVVGDEVCNPWGSVSRVMSIHPQGDVDIYKVVFSDGDAVECTLDHLWEVRNYRDCDSYRVLSLRQIVDNGLVLQHNNQARWHVRLPSPCYYRAQEVSMPPYSLGLLLGNGGFTTSSPTFFSVDDETLQRLSDELPSGHRLVARSKKGNYTIAGLGQGHKNIITQQLRELALWGHGSYDKFIPDLYKYNSKEVRLAVLQGLCDTDGSMDTRGNIEYTTVSRRLAYDIKEVVESLGGLCHVKYRKTRCQTGEFWSYRLHIKHDDRAQFFRLTRKKERSRLRAKAPLSRTIRRVEFVGKKPAQCIRLDSQDGLYLTDHHIVTHNTIFCDNIALHVAGNLGLPVLNLDTEMTRGEHLARILAHICGARHNVPVTIRDIETGKYASDEMARRAVRDSAAWLKTIPYDYDSVVDKSFEEQVASMRRWARRSVGFDTTGRAKDCLVIYDYLQPPEMGEFGENVKEHQVLGYQMISLLKTAARCDIPIFTLVQLNRDGIDKESTGVAADSDRPLRKAANFSILKWKSETEMAQDGDDQGTHKLVPIITRHGEAIAKGDYISIKSDGKTATMTEGKTRNELQQSAKGRPHQQKGFEEDIAEAADGEVLF